MTNAQTEARAIVIDREHYEAADKIWRSSVVMCKHAIATALAAKDAELAKFDFEKHLLKVSLAHAEAQLAEARKALERVERKLTAYVGVCTGDKELTETVLPMVRTARRALTGDTDHD